MNSPESFYESRVKELEIIIAQLERKGRLISFLRLACALIVILIIVYLFKGHNIALWAGLLASVSLFIVLVKHSAKNSEEINYNKELLTVNQNEIRALSGDYSVFDPGIEFIDPSHSFSLDLDLFGEYSIFRVFNRTCTIQGKEILAESIAKPVPDKDIIIERQKAIAELRDKISWRQHFQALGQLTKESKTDREQIDSWLKIRPRFFRKRFYVAMVKVLPVITIALLGLNIAGMITMGLPLLFITGQLTLTFINLKYVNNRQLLIHKHIDVLKKYYKLIESVEVEEFKSTVILAIKNSIFPNNTKPSQSFAKLIKLVEAIDNRMNFLLFIFLNGLLLWDIRYMLKIEKWTDEFKHVFPKWIKAIGQLDALSSLAGFMYNNPEYAIPEISDSETFILDIDDGGHPLIDKKELVTNSLKQDETSSIFLVTGANMAGKSTFLRMIGVNLVLAMSGTCVCARRFKFSPVELYTSMRTNDSLQKHASFFYSELKRLKFIVDKLKENKRCYILLDEILKGTNSNDQHSGSAKLIESLIRLKGTGMIATHDVELTKLTEKYPDKIKNIAFEFTVEDNRMIFNYKCIEGVCQNMNATLLMKQMDIF